jgi:hypothetical protein
MRGRGQTAFFLFSVAALALSGVALGVGPAASVESKLSLQIAGPEEVIFDDRQSNCPIRQFPDSPARAVRQANGDIVMFATFETNWFLTGANWDSLGAICKSAGQASQNADPKTIDDKFWIQALHSLNGRDFIALGSHEYLGSRHPGMCNYTTTGTQAPPCWFSSITQYESRGDARNFVPASVGRVVATPQIPFDPDNLKRIGYFTTSNIVSMGEYRYALIFASESSVQKSGNCLFRSRLTDGPSAWLGWNGSEFAADLSQVPAEIAKQPVNCQPVRGLGHEARGLVWNPQTELWVTTYTGRIRDKTGIVVATSRNMFDWGNEQMLFEAPLTRRDPDCTPVYRYPSIIDHDAPKFAFETIEKRPYLYSVKILLGGCRQTARQIVRAPLRISQ